MAQIGRKLYYELATGNPILDTGEHQGDVVATTETQDFQMYVDLQKYQQSAVGVLQFNFGDYDQNFGTYPWHIDITKSPIDGTAIVWDTANPLGVTLAQAQAAKIAQINDLYSQKLSAGFSSSASGAAEQYPYNTQAEQTFDELYLEIVGNKVIYPVGVYDVNSNSVPFNDAASLTALFNDILTFKATNNTKMHNYIVQVNACTTVDQVNAITIQF